MCNNLYNDEIRNVKSGQNRVAISPLVIDFEHLNEYVQFTEFNG